jgi:hypothetical protein
VFAGKITGHGVRVLRADAGTTAALSFAEVLSLVSTDHWFLLTRKRNNTTLCSIRSPLGLCAPPGRGLLSSLSIVSCYAAHERMSMSLRRRPLFSPGA